MIEHDPHAKSRIFTLGTAGLLSSLLLISPLTTTVSLILYGALQAAAAPSPDFDGNGAVDFADFFLFADAFGSGAGEARYETKYDLDTDQKIGFSDFFIFADNFGKNVNSEPVLHEDHFEVTILGTAGGVNVAVVDGEGFSEGTHGQRISDIFLASTNNARLVQIGGWGSYEINGRTLSAPVMVGYIKHALEHDGGIFWTATDDSPLYSQQTAGQWFVENDRAFLINAREFANWMQYQNTLFIKSLENSSVVSADLPRIPAYCDDFDGEFGWIPLCGSVSDYIAHSGAGTENMIFVGAIKTESGDTATGAIRADGVFAPHTIYVESPDGSTSQATPVLAAYATNLSFANPTWGAARLKQELMKLSREEAIDYDTGATDSQGVIMPERRTIKAIRPAFAP